MNIMKAQLAAILALSIVNAVLLAENIRWILLSDMVRSLLPSSGALDLILDLVPALVIGFLVGLFLISQIWVPILKHRHSLFREELITRALTINSVLLFPLMVLGLAWWIFVYNGMDPSLIALAVAGIAALAASGYLEMRLRRR